jgi:hypothetical protein
MSCGAFRGAYAVGANSAVHRLVGFEVNRTTALALRSRLLPEVREALLWNADVATSVELESHFTTLAQIHEFVNLIAHHGLPVNEMVRSSLRDKL